MAPPGEHSEADFPHYDPSATGRYNLAVGTGVPQLQGRRQFLGVAGQTAAAGVGSQGRGLPGYDYRRDLLRLRAAAQQGHTEAKLQQRVQQPQQRLQVGQGDKKELGAVAYSEKTKGRVDEHAAIVSVVLNRVNSRDPQYVDKSKPVTIGNVITARRQFQAVGRKGYDDFRNGAVSDQGAKNAAKAVDQVVKNGPTTNAMFFIVNPGGKPPAEKQVRNLGRVEPANPPKVGDVYLYKPKSAGKGK